MANFSILFSLNSVEKLLIDPESCRLTEEYRRSAGMICARMEEMYREKKSEWVETYTRRIIEND